VLSADTALYAAKRAGRAQASYRDIDHLEGAPVVGDKDATLSGLKRAS